MKNYTLFLWIALLMLGISGTIGAREVASFNDGWEFKKGPFSKEALQAVQKWNSDWQGGSIPHTWNADDMQKQASAFYEGVGYYRKKFTFPENMEGKRIFLRFEGVGSYAEVYINGYLAGTHKGAYSAFACEISSQVKFGKENEIIVHVPMLSPRTTFCSVFMEVFTVPYGWLLRKLAASLQTTVPLRECILPRKMFQRSQPK